MKADRINPVVLVVGATAPVGTIFARILSSRAQGGLILADHDEAALGRIADDLESLGLAPERLSTLPFDITDDERWAQAEAFIDSQYGRLDWVMIDAGAAPPASDDGLMQWGRPSSPAIDCAFLSLRAAMRLMHKNSGGGAAIVAAPGAQIADRAGLPRLLTAAANEAAHDNIRINTVVLDAAGAAEWRGVPEYGAMVRETGSERTALNLITAMPTPIVRFQSDGDITMLAATLLSDDSALTGATLIVEGGHTL